MSCTPSATGTEYTTITTFTTSTSLSQSVANNQGAVTTVVQQTCIATGTLSGSNSTGCISSTAVTQVNTIAGGAVTTQVPIIVTVPVTQTQPTNTLFASCSDGSTPSQTTSHSTASQTSFSSTPSPVTTSVLVETTPAPSIITQSSSTTLSNGDVVATVFTTTSTLPASSVYVPSVIVNPTVTSTASASGSGTDVAPIVGGVLGGFVGLIAIVGALWYLCRRRRSWDDIFDREAIEDEEFDSPVAVRRDRDRSMLDLGAEPKPYQYGLVGHVTPPPGSSSPPSIHQSHHPSFSASVASNHSRNTSVTPLLGMSSAPGNASKASISGSMQAAQTAIAQRHLSATSQSTSQSSMGPRSLSVVSTTSATPLLDGSGPSLLSSSNRVDELGVFDPLNRTGSPTPVTDRRVLQIINDGPQSPKSPVIVSAPTPAPAPAPAPAPVPSSSVPARPPGKRAPRRRRSNSVVVHTDAGLVSPTSGTAANEPPPYSRE